MPQKVLQSSINKMLLTRDRIFRGSLHIREIRACDTTGPTHNCGYSLWIYCIAQSYFADLNHHNSVVDRNMNTIGIQIRHQSTDSAILGSASSTIWPYIHLSLSTIICFWAEWLKSHRHYFGGIVTVALINGACIYLFVSKRQKPELVGSQVGENTLLLTWQHTSAVARDVEIPWLQDPAELENKSKPADLR